VRVVRTLAALSAIAAASALALPHVRGEARTNALRLQPVARGFASPVHVAAPSSEPGRLYVVEQAGRILVVEGGQRREFLDIRSSVRSGGEQGLFAIAFHPNYARNRRFYIHYTNVNGDTRVVEYRSDGTRALPDSARPLLSVDQPYSNHNGGQLAFGPDGRLYLGLGDGGSGGDPQDRAQNLRSRLGKLLVLNVNRRGARWQVAGYGLRNPWRFSFDRANGDLYVGDVGQNSWEEVDYTPRRSPGLENYGWDVYEGRTIFEQKRRNPRGRLVFPIAVYPLTGGNCTVTGGFVYRGRAVPAARGRYFYGDYCSGRIWSLRVVGGRARSIRREPFTLTGLSSWGEDARGELYAVAHDGVIYRLAD
jgi:glucose/arabinose dehydrogenase